MIAIAELLKIWLKKLANYEDLEEQGRLISLPCKVGDTVYGISMGKIITLTVNEISIFYMKGEKIINVKCQNNDEFRNYVEREFGKTVFLTKSEAEKYVRHFYNKLAELRSRIDDVHTCNCQHNNNPRDNEPCCE